MNLPTVAAIVIATCGLLIASMAALIKGMLLGRLDNIDTKLDGMDGRLNEHNGRIIRLEEWRENTNGGAHAFGRRKIDVCSSPECPYEAGDR
jgi:hypothetical protein